MIALPRGDDFNTLINEYAVKADGTTTDPGMTSNLYTNGYEVSQAILVVCGQRLLRPRSPSIRSGK